MKKLGFNGIYTENVIINFPKENFDENTIIQNCRMNGQFVMGVVMSLKS